MKKEEINLIAQLLTSMKDALDKLEEAEKKQDTEKMVFVKKEILNLQQQIAELI